MVSGNPDKPQLGCPRQPPEHREIIAAPISATRQDQQLVAYRYCGGSLLLLEEEKFKAAFPVDY